MDKVEEEGVKLKQKFLNSLKELLKNNILDNVATNDVMIENTIADCIKVISLKLEEQLILMVEHSDREINKKKVLNDFENGLIDMINMSIKEKRYLHSRLNPQIIDDNQIEIRFIVNEFSKEYFL